MLSHNGARCNDLGGDSSEEDNEKQNDSAGASSPAPLAPSRGSASAAEATSDEEDAAKWHTSKVREGYARFLLVVLSAYKQMMHQDEPVLSDLNEDNFDRAFSFFRPG